MEMKDKLFLLDCTLRDGGYYNDWDFSADLVREYLDAMAAAKVDIVELGLRSLNNCGFKGACAFSTDEYIRSLKVHSALKIGIMINAGELLADLPLADALLKLVPNDADSSPVHLVRIACHVHEFEDALPAANWLKGRGFMVGFNLMQIANHSEIEVRALAKAATDYPIDALYFADSMGSMKPEQTAQIVGWLRSEWRGAIGIHTHDNLGLALSNTLSAVQEGVSFVDSTVTGMGRGPGNARTEELAIEMAELDNRSANIVPLMALIRRHFRPMQQKYGWGTNPYYYLAGKYGIHPTYIQEMLNDSRYTEEDVLAVIEHLKVEGGKRYNPTTLDTARHFYQGDPKGSWCPSGVFKGRDVLLLGTGPGVAKHRVALEAYIQRHQPIVVALNTQTAIEADLIQYRVACHPVRLLADCEAHTRLPQPLITPYSMLPEDVKQSLSGKELLDFGLNVQSKCFSFNNQSCTLPSSLVMAYAFAVLTSGNAKTIYLAGFDGYSGEDARNTEMNNIIKLYLEHPDALKMVALTPTRYDVPSLSVYGL